MGIMWHRQREQLSDARKPPLMRTTCCEDGRGLAGDCRTRHDLVDVAGKRKMSSTYGHMVHMNTHAVPMYYWFGEVSAMQLASPYFSHHLSASYSLRQTHR